MIKKYDNWTNDRYKEGIYIKYQTIMLKITIMFIVGALLSSCCCCLKQTHQVKLTKPALDSEQQFRLSPSRKLVAFFSGQVVSTSGKPIAGAFVEVNGKSTQTNKGGIFKIIVPSKEKKIGNRFVMNIRKEGYGLVSKIYSSGIKDGIWKMTEATRVDVDPTMPIIVQDTRRVGICKGSLSSQVDWSRYQNLRTPRRFNSEGQYIGEATVEIKEAIEYVENASTCNDGISISIPANSLVDSQGNAPTDKVIVSLSTVDIYDRDSMPGDYSVSLRDQTGYMVTYGAGTISVSSRGKNYQLKKGAKATLEIPINPFQLRLSKKIKESIPILLYDEKEGMWRTFGEAKLNPKRNVYVAEINHLSAFNMDLVKTDQACVRIDSSNIDESYFLEIVIPYNGDIITRNVYVENLVEKQHAIYNLPSNTNISLRAFRAIVGVDPIPITNTYEVNTGNPQDPSSPNCPVPPYDACGSQIVLEYATVETADGITRLNNYSSYSIISMNVDGTQYIPSMSSLLPGHSMDITMSQGTHSFYIANGFWDAGNRFEMYTLTGTYTQPGNATTSIDFYDPTINQLLTNFNTTGYWAGTYWDSNAILHIAAFRFYSNGTWKLYVDGGEISNGSYSLVNRNPSLFSVTFSVGNFEGTFYELYGYFVMRNGPDSWPLIEYYYEGP